MPKNKANTKYNVHHPPKDCVWAEYHFEKRGLSKCTRTNTSPENGSKIPFEELNRTFVWKFKSIWSANCWRVFKPCGTRATWRRQGQDEDIVALNSATDNVCESCSNWVSPARNWAKLLFAIDVGGCESSRPPTLIYWNDTSLRVTILQILIFRLLLAKNPVDIISNLFITRFPGEQYVTPL